MTLTSLTHFFAFFCTRVGSGVVLVSYQSIWKKFLQSSDGDCNITLPTFWAADINTKALEATRALVEHNNNIGGTSATVAETNFVESNLFAEVPADQLFDVIIFNPPYVETDSTELEQA